MAFIGCPKRDTDNQREITLHQDKHTRAVTFCTVQEPKSKSLSLLVQAMLPKEEKKQIQSQCGEHLGRLILRPAVNQWSTID